MLCPTVNRIFRRSPNWERESPTFFQNVVQVRHALNVCSSDSPVLSKHRIDFLSEFLKHAWISNKKTAVILALAEAKYDKYANLQGV